MGGATTHAKVLRPPMDLDVAVATAVNGAFFSTGQRCTASSRLIVTAGIHDAFLEKLTSAATDLIVGDALDAATQIGPVVDQKQLDQNLRYLKLASDEGCDVRGGELANGPGFFMKPAIFAGATNQMTVSREEIFGPMASVIKVADYDEALAVANDTEFGLAAYFYSRDIGRIWRVAEGLEYGIVGVNEGIISTEVAPFGGVKESGTGREGSKYGIEDYLELKYLCMGGIND